MPTQSTKIIHRLRLAQERDLFRSGHGILTQSPAGLAPLAVFRVLRERFGKPNDWRDPEKSIWGWALAGSNGVLTVYDWKGGWSIGFLREGGLSPELQEDAEALLADLTALAPKIRVSRDAIVAGIITNPYRIFSDMAENLLEQIDDLDRETEAKLEGLRGSAGASGRAAPSEGDQK